MLSDLSFEKGLPSNTEAERSILGAILLNNAICSQAIELMRREDFFLDSHRRIFDKMVALTERGVPIDLVTLGEELRRAGEFEQVGGATYIASLIDGVPGTDTIEHYARIVKERAAQRRIIALSNIAAARAWDSEESAVEVLGYLEHELVEVSNGLRASDPRLDARDRIITADELMAMDFPEPRWAVEGIIQEGAVILAGRPKLGKSFLALNISLAVASGGYALGCVRVERGAVLHLALEDGLRRFQKRLKGMWDARVSLPDMHVKTQWPRLDGGGAKALDVWLSAHKNARLVVIDTFKKVRPLPRRGSGLYDEDYDGMVILADLAELHGVAILIIHHTNKKLDLEDPLDLVSGSTGLTGAADEVLVLKRERGRHDATLFITGRDVEERELALEVDSQIGTWRLLGEADGYRVSEERAEILKTLKDADSLLTPTEIAKRLGKRPDTMRQLVRRMAGDGQLQSKSGKYGLPHHSGHPGHSHHADSDGVMGEEDYPSLSAVGLSDSGSNGNGKGVMAVTRVTDEMQNDYEAGASGAKSYGSDFGYCPDCGAEGIRFMHCERCGEMVR